MGGAVRFRPYRLCLPDLADDLADAAMQTESPNSAMSAEIATPPEGFTYLEGHPVALFDCCRFAVAGLTAVLLITESI